MNGWASQKSAHSIPARRRSVVAADFKVPFFDFLLHRPFTTVRDRRATTRSLLPAAFSNRPRTTSGHRCCATGEVRRATPREAVSRGAVNHGERNRRGHRGTRACFIESGPFARRPDQDRIVAPSVHLRRAADRARAVHLPWRSNDVGRRSRTVAKRTRGEGFVARGATRGRLLAFR